jgi:hypothetical protein
LFGSAEGVSDPADMSRGDRPEQFTGGLQVRVQYGACRAAGLLALVAALDPICHSLIPLGQPSPLGEGSAVGSPTDLSDREERR